MLYRWLTTSKELQDCSRADLPLGSLLPPGPRLVFRARRMCLSTQLSTPAALLLFQTNWMLHSRSSSSGSLQQNQVIVVHPAQKRAEAAEAQSQRVQPVASVLAYTVKSLILTEMTSLRGRFLLLLALNPPVFLGWKPRGVLLVWLGSRVGLHPRLCVNWF